MLYSYSKLTLGWMASRTLSLLPDGETHKPWECRLVTLKQPLWLGKLISVLAHFLGSCSGNWLYSQKRTVCPGRITTVGARKDEDVGSSAFHPLSVRCW